MLALSHKFYRKWMFVLGIIATIAYRIIVVLNHYSPLAVQISWYIGTIGFVWYFAHRYKVENKRDRLITDLSLVDKIRDRTPLNQEERNSLVYILKGLQTSLSKWNYVFIFILSTLALLYGIIQDILYFIK
ncbi:MAG: hypothetical protein PF488_01775 [Patescibacteria group bacterium]|jgi:hypothetical protein|nr:hypothetical protein [Patescibacteria group bacterium]